MKGKRQDTCVEWEGGFLASGRLQCFSALILQMVHLLPHHCKCLLSVPTLLPDSMLHHCLTPLVSFAVFFRKLAYGVHPMEVAEEVLCTVSRKKQEVFMANPIPKAAVYIRIFFPALFFAIVASGTKDKQKVEEQK